VRSFRPPVTGSSRRSATVSREDIEHLSGEAVEIVETRSDGLEDDLVADTAIWSRRSQARLVAMRRYSSMAAGAMLRNSFT
jgi:hypothetical protein